MNSATGSESTPMRRIWTTTRRAQMPTSRRPRTMSIRKWPKRPRASMAEMERRPMASITGSKSRPKTVGAQDVKKGRGAACCAPTLFQCRKRLRGEARERLPDVSVPQPLQCAVTQLPDALPSDAEHAADLFERVLAPAVETEVQPQHLGVTPLQRVQRLLDLVRQEAVHRLIFGVRQILRDEALDQRAITVGIERRVEPHIARVQRGERLHDFERQLGRVGDLFRRRLAAQRLAQILRRAHDARQIGGAVERHADRAALPRERGEDRLADPPHGVRDELHALIGIELARGGKQADVALADEISERQTAILVLLRDRDHEPQVALHELLHRLLVAGAHLARERDLLFLRKQRSLGDLVQVLVEDVALVLMMAEAREQTPAPAAAPALRGRLCLRGGGGSGCRSGGLRLFPSARHLVALIACCSSTQTLAKCSWNRREIA